LENDGCRDGDAGEQIGPEIQRPQLTQQIPQQRRTANEQDDVERNIAAQFGQRKREPENEVDDDPREGDRCDEAFARVAYLDCFYSLADLKVGCYIWAALKCRPYIIGAPIASQRSRPCSTT